MYVHVTLSIHLLVVLGESFWPRTGPEFKVWEPVVWVLTFFLLPDLDFLNLPFQVDMSIKQSVH